MCKPLCLIANATICKPLPRRAAHIPRTWLATHPLWQRTAPTHLPTPAGITTYYCKTRASSACFNHSSLEVIFEKGNNKYSYPKGVSLKTSVSKYFPSCLDPRTYLTKKSTAPFLSILQTAPSTCSKAP